MCNLLDRVSSWRGRANDFWARICLRCIRWLDLKTEKLDAYLLTVGPERTVLMYMYSQMLFLGAMFVMMFCLC